ncbi:MAG: hypothetical protein FWB95_06135 [Treponema sp.]|nr:hypothetical protein [Treponema sp.]
MKNDLISRLFPLFVAFLFLFIFAGCGEEPTEEDKTVSSITLFNIPEYIVVDNPVRSETHPYYHENTNKKSEPFSVYINVSNNMDHTDKEGNLLLPEAKGYAQFKDAVFDETTRTYSITVNFMDPNPGFGMPPYNWRDKQWKGTANYFSVSISPYDITEFGLDEVWVRGGLTLNKGKESYDWTKLIDFRNTNTIDYTYQADELYKLIVSADRNIKSGTRPYHYGYPHGGDTEVACPGHEDNGCNKYSTLGKPCTHNTTHAEYYCYPHFPDYKQFSYDDYYKNGKYTGAYVLN